MIIKLFLYKKRKIITFEGILRYLDYDRVRSLKIESLYMIKWSLNHNKWLVTGKYIKRMFTVIPIDLTDSSVSIVISHQ